MGNRYFKGLKVVLLTAVLCLSVQGICTDLAPNINFHGVIMPSTCNVESESRLQDVDLGDYSRADFTAVGDRSSAKMLLIKLTDCSSSITDVIVQFLGHADVDNAQLLALSAGNGNGITAQGIAISISDQMGNNLPINEDSQPYELTQGDNQLSFLLRYQATKLPIISGDANSTLYFNLAYE